jgi:CRP-like cAMP-binding protein/ActR/RegA family two-component response regulator
MKTILIIEDNNEIRENLAEILELANYKVFTAENGKVGVAVATEQKPDLIVCDIMMPVLDGYGVIHMLQKNPDTQSIPFIFLTAKAERAEIRKGMELGADDYLTKPLNGTELLNAVESRLRKSEVLKERLAGISGLNTLIDSISGKEALKKFIENRSTGKYKKKQVIYSEGNHPNRLFYVEKGKVKTYKTNDDGKEFIVGLYNEGDFIGYTSLLEGTVYKETAEAIEEAEIAAIPRSEFDELINSNRDVLLKFVQLLANNVSERENQLLGIAYNSIRKKVADALIMLSKKYRSENDAQFSMHISRENLANMAGTAKESLIRTLSDFKDENLIDIREGDIVILNEKKLSNMLN